MLLKDVVMQLQQPTLLIMFTPHLRDATHSLDLSVPSLQNHEDDVI